METINLYRPNDLHSEYVSPDGAVWNSYDARSDENPMTCEICNAEVWDGFLCMDGGNEVCADHVVIVPAFIGEKLAAEFKESIAAHSALVQMRCFIGNAMRECFAAEHMPGKYLGWVQPRDGRVTNAR